MALLLGEQSRFGYSDVKRDRVKHILSAGSLTRDFVDEICQLSDVFERERTVTSRVAGRSIALLFFQASTRTRLGFEVATVALGCHPVGFDDMSASRSNRRTGETLEDCAAVVSNLCDAIVVRHHEVGAAARMAARSRGPVINAGDGWNEHPTQALIDIYAMRRALGSLRGRGIGFCGDPRGRTVRSLVQLLRHEQPQELVFCPPPHLPVPQDVISILEMHQVRWRLVGHVEEALRACDALMMSPFDMSDIGEAASSGYVSPRETPASHVVTPDLIARTASRTLLFHPLPRQDEIDPACDELENAMYFEQVRLSKFVRMAVLDRALSAL
jgi:aspartate carbamoyltransferase catalytic subunit